MVCLYYFFFSFFYIFFFFNDTATTEIYTLSLHDALPISMWPTTSPATLRWPPACMRSEEHTSELQSRENLVCRLLLEKKKQKTINQIQRKKKTPLKKQHTDHITR